jgi:GNAT superfamily N-acetyltransferase
MSERFLIRPATPTDADIIAWHRARMFEEMGEVPANLFDAFLAKSRENLHEVLTSGEYMGWLASPTNALEKIIGGAGVHLRRVLTHPLTASGSEVTIAEGRHAIIQNVFIEPDWRRRGIAAILVQRIIDWAQQERLDRLVLHSSNAGRALYQRLGFVATNEMKFVGPFSDASP